MSEVLENIVKRWQNVVRRAKAEKKKHFGDQAEDAMKFYAETDHSFLYTQAYLTNSTGLQVSGIGDPSKSLNFKATLNLTSNVVQVFLPVLYHRNPTRTVTEKQCEVDFADVQQVAPVLGFDLNEQAMAAISRDRARKRLTAKLFHHALNASPRELNLKDHARLSIAEAIIKGMGVMWLETFPSSDGTKLVGLSHDSIDYFYADPDAELLSDGGFVIRERCEPTYQIELKFGLPAGTLSEYADDKAYKKSAEELAVYEGDAESGPDGERVGMSTDVMTYYEFYSRIGLGTNLKKSEFGDDFDDAVTAALDGYGEEVYLAIPSARSNCPFPLNLPAYLTEQPETPELQEEIRRRVQWPVACHEDRANPWPCVVLGFHPMPKKIWCHSHLTPVMGVQKAIDWIMSFMVGRMQITSRQFMVVPQNIPPEVEEAILFGSDLTLLKIDQEHPGTQQKLCDFLKMPEINGEMWNLLMALKKEFEDGTGVTELNLAGRTPFQMRSAKEATVRQQMLSVRPDDMANIVENWMGAGARLEAGAAAELYGKADAARIFGETMPQEAVGADGQPFEQAGLYASLWDALIASRSRAELFSELDFSIESGSARKPNNEELISNVDESAQIMLPGYWQYFGNSGDPTPLNAWTALWAKSRNIPDFAGLMLPDMRQQMAMQQQAAMTGSQPVQGGGVPQDAGAPPQLQEGGSAPPMTPELMMQLLATGQLPPQEMGAI